MGHPTPATYKSDSLFPRVERAVSGLLAQGRAVTAPDVFVAMGMLTPTGLAEWRLGRVPYLEGVIQGSLSKINRILRIISLLSHDLSLSLAPPHVAGNVKVKGRPLRFSKTLEPGVEECARRAFVARPPRRPRGTEETGAENAS
jgi:hypothetical protein